MNVLRLPINWSLLEPTRGAIDDAYVHQALQLASDCAQQGVYTFIDLHQDGWSKYVGDKGGYLCVDRFGASAPAEDVFKDYGFTVENAVKQAKGLL